MLLALPVVDDRSTPRPARLGEHGRGVVLGAPGPLPGLALQVVAVAGLAALRHHPEPPLRLLGPGLGLRLAGRGVRLGDSVDLAGQDLPGCGELRLPGEAVAQPLGDQADGLANLLDREVRGEDPRLRHVTDEGAGVDEVGAGGRLGVAGEGVHAHLFLLFRLFFVSVPG